MAGCSSQTDTLEQRLSTSQVTYDVSEGTVGHSKRKNRGETLSGLTHECGVFGAIGTGEWPTHLEISQIITWGLVALQHR